MYRNNLRPRNNGIDLYAHSTIGGRWIVAILKQKKFITHPPKTKSGSSRIFHALCGQSLYMALTTSVVHCCAVSLERNIKMRGNAPERLGLGSDDITIFLRETVVKKHPKSHLTGHQQKFLGLLVQRKFIKANGSWFILYRCTLFLAFSHYVRDAICWFKVHCLFP